jgi:hypothetical protein
MRTSGAQSPALMPQISVLGLCIWILACSQAILVANGEAQRLVVCFGVVVLERWREFYIFSARAATVLHDACNVFARLT